MRIGWSPSVIFVPVSGPAVTTRVLGAPRVFFFPGAEARGGTEATRPARPPNRSARTTRNAAKMNSHSSSRKPNRKICRTISAVTRRPLEGPLRPLPSAGALSRAVLPVDQHRVADADHVAVREGLAGDPPAVDQRAVGRAEVLADRRAAVEHDVDVLAADAGVGQPDVGLGAAADDVAAGGEHVAGAPPVDDEHVLDPRAGPAGDRRRLPAGVGGDPAAGPRQRREGGGRGAGGAVPRRLARGRAGRVGDVRAPLEHAGGQVVVLLQCHLDGAEGLVALGPDVLGDHVGELGGQLVGPLGEVVVVDLAEPDDVHVGGQDTALADHVALLVGFALEGLGDLGRVHLALEDAGEGQADHALESSLEALQHTHSRSLALASDVWLVIVAGRTATERQEPATPRWSRPAAPTPVACGGLLMFRLARASGGMADAHG